MTEHWEQIEAHLPEDLRGWQALDIGCGTGEASCALAKRGASVLGIDTDPDSLAAARASASELGLTGQIEFEQKWVYDLASTWETYDLVLLTRVLSQLRYPVLGLDAATRKTRRLLVLQDASSLDAEPMLQAVGLRVLKIIAPGTYLCEPDPVQIATLDAEYQSAIGLTPRLTKTLTFKHCWVNSAPGYTETCYHDGTKVTATPEDSESYRANAVLFGYGTDTAALSREHEILHTFLAEKLGYGTSPTLWAVAHNFEGQVAQIWEQEEEESWTLPFQAYLHGAPETEALQRFIDAGYTLEELREEARRLLR